MPTIYEYLGIIIKLYTDDHEPIHIHAEYGNATVKVIFHMEGENIYRTTYKVTKGTVAPAKMKQLKDFVNAYKYAIVYAWHLIVEQGVKVKKMVITQKIK